MRAGRRLGRAGGLAHGGDESVGRLEEQPSVLLERQHVVPLAGADESRGIGPAMQGIGGDDGAFEVERGEQLERTLGLVAVGRLALGQRKAGLRRPEIDHVQGHRLLAAGIGATQRLAVEGDHALGAEPFGELAQYRHQRLRLQGPEHIAERVVARDAVRQLQDLAQCRCPTQPKSLELDAALGPRQRRRQRDEQDLHQIVTGVARPWVLDPAKQTPEPTHFGLPPSLGDLLRIHSKPAGNTAQMPNAIPLPLVGGEAG